MECQNGFGECRVGSNRGDDITIRYCGPDSGGTMSCADLNEPLAADICFRINNTYFSLKGNLVQIYIIGATRANNNTTIVCNVTEHADLKIVDTASSSSVIIFISPSKFSNQAFVQVLVVSCMVV